MNKRLFSLFSIGLFFLTLVSCTSTNSKKDSVSKLKGNIVIDGSSTTYPMTEIIAEEFSYKYPHIRVSIGESGTGGGIKKFTEGRIDIVNASRRITSSEYENALNNQINPVELIAAMDGISIVVNSKNNFAKNLTKEELNHIFRQDNPAKYWSDVREGFPKELIKVYTPGTSSGTFEFFTEIINEQSKSQREDAILSENDNVLIRGISEDKYAIGYFGYGYYEANKSKINLVSIDGIAPSNKTIYNKSYLLSRDLYIYFDKNDLDRQEINKFIEFYMMNANKLANEVKLVGLSQDDYNAQLSNIQ